MATTTFGPAFTAALLVGCEQLSAPGWPVPPEWTLAKLALESGFNPLAENKGSRARGLWQCMPREVRRVDRFGDWGPLGSLDFTRTNGDGSTSVMRKYACPAPDVQLAEAFTFWRQFRVDGFRSREALYCANISPARLRRPYDDDTIIYSANPEDAHLPDATFWPRAYHDNAAPFGLDPNDPLGRIRMRDLAVGLDKYVRENQTRYDAELAAAIAMRANGAPPLAPVEVPDMRDPWLSEPRFGDHGGEPDSLLHDT